MLVISYPFSSAYAWNFSLMILTSLFARPKVSIDEKIVIPLPSETATVLTFWSSLFSSASFLVTERLPPT